MSKSRKRAKEYRNTQKSRAPLIAKTPAQGAYIDAIKHNDQVVCLGPAGSGKTFIAASLAADALMSKQVNKIVLTRPNVPTGPTIGALPGTLEEKFAPWAAPILDTLSERMGRGHFEEAFGKTVLVVPTEYIRGRSFENAFIIVDEAANLTFDQIKALLTRQGEASTMVLNGDVQQNDLGPTSGLTKLLDIIKRRGLPVPVVEFGVDDIVRSASCKMWIETFLKEGV